MTVATKLTNLVVRRKVFPIGSATPGKRSGLQEDVCQLDCSEGIAFWSW